MTSGALLRNGRSPARKRKLNDKTLSNAQRLVQANAGDWHRVVIATKFRVVAPSEGRKFVQTRAEDKLVWTMPSAAEFGETQKIIF